ncbi:MAG: hypothetical protein LUD68_08665, partial [Rikenellaceae bacterium]|nr:hypothetical protein [Rikenellaceae bacterium]
MKKILLSILLAGPGPMTFAQAPGDTTALPLYDPSTTVSGYSDEFIGEEDYSGYFLPASTGNNSYQPIGQLSRNLIGVRFRPRGTVSRYEQYEVNGAELFDPTDGFPYWNIIAGLNLLLPTHNDVPNSSAGAYRLGGIGGIVSLSTTDRYDSGSGRISYAYTNCSYRHRITVQDRKQTPSGGSAAYGLSAQQGADGFVKGVFSNRINGAVESHRRLGRQQQHLLSGMAAFSLSEQGVRAAATGQVYELTGDPFYNPNWGYQNGKIRNSRQRGYKQYFTALSYTGSPTESWTVRASVSFLGGENSYTLLSWYAAPTPYPDYYRYLPDFFANPLVSEPLRERWHAGDPSVTGIDWHKLYEANRYNTDDNGLLRSHYILRDRVTQKSNLAFSGSLEYLPAPQLTVRGGVRVRSDYAGHFARLTDLLGGNYWLDIDQYLLEDEYYGGMYQNDVRHPDRPVDRKGRFGYNYRMRSFSYRMWSSVHYRSADWSAFAGAEAATVAYRREGKYEKEMFPDYRSFGKSRKIEFSEYTLKAGFFYHFNFRHRIGIQAASATQAPLVRHLFVAPDYRNETISDPDLTAIRSAKLIYQRLSPVWTLDLSAYLTRFSGETEIRNFYDDIESEYMNLVLSGIGKIHGGLEVGMEWNLTPRLSVRGGWAGGIYQYATDPSVTLFRDSDGQVLLSGAPSFLKGYRLSGTPQTAGMLQINLRIRSYWHLEVTGKYTAHNYVAVNPVRRMTRALDLAGSPEIQREMAHQERLDDAFLLSLSVSRTFRLGNGNRIGLWT